MLGLKVKFCKTAGAVQVNVSVVGVTPQQSSNEAFLSGQTLTSLNASGVADIQDLILRAAPGFYNLVVALADYPQVTLLATLLLWCAAVEVCCGHPANDFALITLHLQSIGAGKQ